MNWYIGVLKNYIGFTGRARRTEFWMFALINAIIAIVLSIIDQFIGSQVLLYIYSLAVLLPGLAVAVRRLHDTDRSGLWILIGLIPIIGAIVLLVFEVLPGTPGPNKYGPDPKPAPAVA